MKPLRIALIIESENDIRLISSFHTSELMIMGQFNHPRQYEENDNSYDIIVLDIEAAGSHALSMIEKLVAQASYAKIIIICTNTDGQQVRTLIQSGVTGIILRHELSNGFIYFARTVYAGHIAISPVILKQLLT